MALVAIGLLLRMGVGDRPLSAAEIDALAGGARLADALTDDEPLASRLREGFDAVERHPEAAALRDQKAWRLRVADPPLPRWLVAASGATLDGARWIAALLVALTAVGVGLLAGSLWTGALVLLALPAVWDAGAGATALARAAASMLALLTAVDRVGSGRGGGLALGLALGLTWLVHPGGLFLLIPALVAIAIAQGPAAREASQAGLAPLPTVPLTVFMAPVLALGVLVLAWPSLWSETGKHLAAWFTDTWWLPAGEQDLAGAHFRQGSDRAPQAWAGLWSWAIWTSPTLVVAWCAGLWATVKAGRVGPWAPVLMVATVALVGGADGGLFGGRMELLPWLWAPTAVTAAVGLRWIAEHLPTHVGLWPARAVAGALVAWPLGMAVMGVSPPGAATAGALLRQPLPLAQLRAMAEATEGGSVHIASGQIGYRLAAETAAETAGIELGWAGRDRATWLVVVDSGADKVERVLAARQDDEPSWEATVAGVRMLGFERR